MDLFNSDAPVAANAPRVHTVSEVTRIVREVLETGIGFVWVEGEISNYRKQASGHQYFTLKDAQAQLQCVLFARPGQWRKVIPLSDGMQVQVRGAMTVYEARGQYQLNVQLVQAGGAGLLQAKFEALKRKLDAEGLFAASRKRPLPKLPATIGIITSPSGAALHDMLNIFTRRAPWLRIIISPVRVQGEGAAEEMANALHEMNRYGEDVLPRPELVVLARGGGSVEDLWQFNEEILARAIVASGIPVVSAVGHEIDFTIADFVADLRAPTPSAAAELVVPEASELLRRTNQLAAQAQRCASVHLERYRNRVAVLARGALFAEPRRRFEEAAQRIDYMAEALHRAVQNRSADAQRAIATKLATLREHRPDHVVILARKGLADGHRRLVEAMKGALLRWRQRFERSSEMLRLLAPATVLKRGFSITTLPDGTLVGSIARIAPGVQVRTQLKDGAFDARVDSVHPREES